MTIFGPDFGALQLHDVAAFLAEADDESLLWEAKGGEGRPNAGAVRKAVRGFANSRGGYLILGTDRAGGAWTITGHDFGGEPTTWVDQVIRDGMSPVPPHAIRAFDVADGRTLVVIKVDTVAEPPCIRNDGVIFQRVSGRTIRRLRSPSASRTARRVPKRHLSLFSRSRPSRTGTTSSDGSSLKKAAIPFASAFARFSGHSDTSRSARQ